jgi:hypothetical protein
MPVQVPGVRPPDVLHKDCTAVQGIEVFAGRVFSIPSRDANLLCMYRRATALVACAP